MTFEEFYQAMCRAFPDTMKKIEEEWGALKTEDDLKNYIEKVEREAEEE